MVKDSAGNTVSKKKKSSADSVVDTDIYKKVINFEEKEALQRSSVVDAELYIETCGNIRKLLTEIFHLKAENKKENKAIILQKRTEACVHTVLLKKLNRLDKVRLLHAREALTQEKQKVDSIHLQLQNLLYELAHVTTEFKKCQQYKSKDEDIELKSIEEYLASAPPEEVKKFEGKPLEGTLKHELHLAMLEDELNQRIQLSNLCDTLENKKKKLAKDIISRKEKLEGLGPRLTAVVDATKPLQEQLGVPTDKIRAEHKLASLLPVELYLLYCYGDAFKQVNEIGVSIDIIGDQEEAMNFIESEKVSNDQDSDLEVDLQEELAEDKKRRHRKASHVDKNEEKKKKLLESHPLAVEVSLSLPDGGPSLKINFLYRPHLKIVTVTSTVDIPDSITGNSAGEILTGDSVLNELFEGDFGKESPNPCNIYQFKKVGLSSYESLVHKLGYAYIWAQKICGLDFLNPQNRNLRTNELSHDSVEVVLKCIQKRLKSRFALAEQLQQLEQNCIFSIPDTVEYPKTAISTLTKFSSITFQKFCQDTPKSMDLIDNGIVGCNDMFYTVTVARPKAILHASVVIKNDYPLRAPMFIITLKFNGDYNATNSDEIRDMERAVNIGWEKNVNTAGWLLSAQLRCLCSLLDVYLETTEGSGFSQSTVFFKNVCAKNRRRPFKFQKVGSGIYTQY